MTTKQKEFSNRLKLLIPIEQLEVGAQDQIWKTLEKDFVKRLVILPGAHRGYDLPIEAVAETVGIISPGYVGYDIGCGMCFVKTTVKASDMFKRKNQKVDVMDKLYDTIPCGIGVEHKTSQRYNEFKSALGNKDLDKKVNNKIIKQLGTLGSGNHFLEIGENREGFVCITIHSGSRKPGWDTADHYMRIGSYLKLDSDLGQAYLQDMNFFLGFALENRLRMIKVTLEVLGFNFKEVSDLMKTIVNENHNHAVLTKDGTVLHRKGATSAEKGQIGIIPANMRDGVYITRGLGNEEYLSSASHGAGRTLSRTAAKKKIQLDRFETQMKGIVAKVSKKVIEESPDAYKKIESVLEPQEGVVINVIDHVKTLIVVKGENRIKNTL